MSGNHSELKAFLSLSNLNYGMCIEAIVVLAKQ